MDANQLLAWENAIGTLVGLGVKSWSVIHAALQDAGADDAAIAALAPKWDALAADVAKAAGGDPAA